MIAVVIAIVVIVLVILGVVLTKYTNVGLSYRKNRLHKQVDKRYAELSETYEASEAKDMLEAELDQNKLVSDSYFDGEALVICYSDEDCEDYYIGEAN